MCRPISNLQVVAREVVWHSKSRSKQVLSGNAGKNRMAHAQLVPINLVPFFAVLDCPKLRPPIPFQVPEFQPEKYFRGPEKCDQIPPRPQKEQKMQNRGPEKTFRGERKVARKMERGGLFYLRLGLFYFRLVFVTYGGLFCLRLKFGLVFFTYG